MVPFETFIQVASASLHASIVAPASPKWFVTFAHGSFLQDKNGNFDSSQKWMFARETPQRNLFVDIERYLLARGFGSLRYDKRASGKSTGVYEDTDLDVLAEDLSSVVAYIKNTFGARVLIIGQSEGGLTAALAQERFKNADALILQGGMLAPLDVILNHQKTRAAKAFLEDTGDLFESMPYYYSLYQHCYNRPEFMRALLETKDRQYLLKEDRWQHLTCLEKYRQHQKYDGRRILSNIQCPVAVLWGDQDANCPVSIALELQASGADYPRMNVSILKDLDHSFRRANSELTFLEQMALPIDLAYWDALEASIQFIMESEARP